MRGIRHGQAGAGVTSRGQAGALAATRDRSVCRDAIASSLVRSGAARDAHAARGEGAVSTGSIGTFAATRSIDGDSINETLRAESGQPFDQDRTVLGTLFLVLRLAVGCRTTRGRGPAGELALLIVRAAGGAATGFKGSARHQGQRRQQDTRGNRTVQHNLHHLV